MNDNLSFQELTEPQVENFLARFQNFYDSVLREAQIFFMSNGLKTQARVVLSVIDDQQLTGERWINLTLEIEEVFIFRLLERNKTTRVVLSYGLDIKFWNGDIYLDFSPIDDDPLKSNFLIVGKRVKWCVSAYEKRK